MEQCTVKDLKEQEPSAKSVQEQKQTSQGEGGDFTYAASEAVAATTMEYFMASFSSRDWTSWATVERF